MNETNLLYYLKFRVLFHCIETALCILLYADCTMY